MCRSVMLTPLFKIQYYSTLFNNLELKFMAVKADKTEYSVQDKIAALYELQKVDSQIDEINKIKGLLPSEVRDLEDEVAGLGVRLSTLRRQVEELGQRTRQAKEEIESEKAKIAKYNEDQRNVRNNREFDAIAKEIEYCELQIQLGEKHIKEFNAEMKVRKKQVEDTEHLLSERQIDLSNKKSELESIEADTAIEMDKLMAIEEDAKSKIDERLLAAYERIRRNVRNGLAVVMVKRDACGGCYNHIPPQRQFEIRQNKKVIICEYCGRILVSDELE